MTMLAEVASQAGNKYLGSMLDQAKLYYKKADWGKAVDLLEQIGTKPSSYLVESTFMLANAYHNQGRISKALTQFKKVLEIDSEHTDTMVSLAVILNDIGHYDEARKFFELADSKIKRNSLGIMDPHVNKKFSELHDELAQMYVTYRRYDEALREYEIAIGLDPENVDLKLKQAKVYYKKNDFPGAKEKLIELKRHHSSCIQAMIILGEIYCAEGKLLDAHKEWNKVLTLDPANNEAKMLLNFAKDVKEISIN